MNWSFVGITFLLPSRVLKSIVDLAWCLTVRLYILSPGFDHYMNEYWDEDFIKYHLSSLYVSDDNSSNI